ncbi:alpha/beta fold hydrolase [Streptomyces nogalater]
MVLLHGFPESWHSWHRQFGPLAAAGFRVVAPDQRGYGRSDHPEAVDAYTILHLVGDVVGLIRELGEEKAYVVGHDWGAPVAWHTALLRPDLVRGVAGLSVPPPFRGRGLRCPPWTRGSAAASTGTTSTVPEWPTPSSPRTPAPRCASSSTGVPATLPAPDSGSRWWTPSAAGSRTWPTPRCCRSGSPRRISTRSRRASPGASPEP